MSGSASPRPLTGSLALTLGATLSVGAIGAMIDIIALRGEKAAAGLIIVALYMPPSLLLGVAAGFVLWGWRTSFGEAALRRAYRRLASDRDLDRVACAGVLAGVVAAAFYAGALILVATSFVAGVQRQSVGALLFATGAIVLLPVASAVAVVAYRATRRVAFVVPRLGSLPATVGLVAAGTALLVAAVALVVFTRLAWRALDLAFYTLLTGFGAGVLVWLALWYGPLTAVRERIPRRGTAVAVAVLGAVLIAAIGLRSAPSATAVGTLSEDTTAARVLLGLARSLSDGDGDGYSALLGGPDCDDANADVHPDAAEIPGNGIDDNCIGGDRAARAAVEPATKEVEAAPSGPRVDGNLLFILVDTTRGDRLGAAGYQPQGRSRTPRLDQLAAEGTYFPRAFAQAPNTARSIPSIMTGRYPSQIAVDKATKNFPKTLDDNVTLFELLAERGMVTAGFASHYYFQVNPGIRQGFAEFDNRDAAPMEHDKEEIAAPRIVPRALEAIERFAKAGDRFAIFVHLFEPHSSYMRHQGIPVRSGRMTDRYDGELEAADRWVGELLAGLERAGISDETVVVITSDHGEGFGEHSLGGRRMFYHGRTLYQEILHVPLIIRVPGQSPRRIDSPVAMIDLMPTLLDLFDAPKPDGLAGRSLAPAIVGQPVTERPVFSELLPASYWKHAAKSMISADGTRKLIQYLIPDRRVELFDLAADPGETKNLANKRPDEAARMRERLIEWIELDLAPR